MRTSVVACVVSFFTALVIGTACWILFLYLAGGGDISILTGVHQPPFIYAGLPVVALLGSSMAFAHWNLSAARIFAIVSVVVFFAPVVYLVAFADGYRSPHLGEVIPRWAEVVGFVVMTALSLWANWYAASLVWRQLQNRTPNPGVHTDAQDRGAPVTPTRYAAGRIGP